VVVEAETGSFVAECFWPDVREQDVRELDRRIVACAEALGARAGVRYLGSILIREDEVVLCQFEGPLTAVREVVEQAAVPLDRLLATAVAPAPPGAAPSAPDTND
jgi:hypothetical protein